jgi:PHD/YefM family antitoxin component YafN of YafNO toxin-antitoxin module
MDILGALKNTVSISLFNKGQASKIFDSVRKTGIKIVMKNNKPECVLISPEDYVKMIDQLNDAKLLMLANERMAKVNPEKMITQKEFDEKYGIMESDLQGFDEVEFE